MNNGLKYWLRWIAVFPVSFIVMNVCLGIWQIDTRSALYYFYRIVLDLCAGGVFIYIGYQVAPIKNKTTEIALVTMLLLLYLSVLFFIILSKDISSHSLIRLTPVILGSIVFYVYLYRKKTIKM